MTYYIPGLLKRPFLYLMTSLTDENTEHFALCKMNDTLGPSSINTDPFLDDIRTGFEKMGLELMLETRSLIGCHAPTILLAESAN